METTSITIGGKAYPLRLEIQDLIAVEQQIPNADPVHLLRSLFITEPVLDSAGLPIVDDDGNAAMQVRVKSIRAVTVLFWAGIQHENAMSLDKATELVEQYRKGGGNLLELATNVWSAWDVGGVSDDPNASTEAATH